MTQRRKNHCPHCGFDLNPISNYFDRLLEGIGHRGSSFTDVDAATHDEKSGRWLFQEFKGTDEELNRGQAKHLKALARKDYLTVWCVRRRADGLLDWCDVRSRTLVVITEQEYQRLFQCWWNRASIIARCTNASPTARRKEATAIITAEDIDWGGQ